MPLNPKKRFKKLHAGRPCCDIAAGPAFFKKKRAQFSMYATRRLFLFLFYFLILSQCFFRKNTLKGLTNSEWLRTTKRLNLS